MVLATTNAVLLQNMHRTHRLILGVRDRTFHGTGVFARKANSGTGSEACCWRALSKRRSGSKRALKQGRGGAVNQQRVDWAGSTVRSAVIKEHHRPGSLLRQPLLPKKGTQTSPACFGVGLSEAQGDPLGRGNHVTTPSQGKRPPHVREGEKSIRAALKR